MPQCKERCWPSTGWGTSQCLRPAKKEGYCIQHHPDSIKKRRIKQDKKWAWKRIIEAAQSENRVRYWCSNNGYILVNTTKTP